jgi:WD40 repeat protein
MVWNARCKFGLMDRPMRNIAFIIIVSVVYLSLAAAIADPPGGSTSRPATLPASLPAGGPSSGPTTAPSRFNAAGEPIPGDAVDRLGSARFHVAPGFPRMEISPDGNRAYTAMGQDLLIWDLSSGLVSRQVKLEQPLLGGFAVSRDGTRLAGKGNGILEFYDLKEGNRIAQVKADDSLQMAAESGVVFTADGNHVVSIGGRNLYLRGADGNLVKSVNFLKGQGIVSSATSTPDGKLIAIAIVNYQTRSTDITFFDGPQLSPLDDPVKMDMNGIVSMCLSPDGTLLGIGRPDGTTVLVDVKTRKTLWTLAQSGKGQVMGIAISKDNTVLVTCDAQRMSFWKIGAAVPESPFARSASYFGYAPPQLRQTADGKRLVYLPQGQAIEIVDIHTGKELVTSPGHVAAVASLQFSPDGKTLASAGMDARVILWDVLKRQERLRFNAAAQCGRAMSFSPDGQWLATAQNMTNKATLWPVTGRGEPVELTTGGQYPWGALFCDANTVVVAGQTSLSFWSPAAPSAPTNSLDYRNSMVVGLAVSPDGKTLAYSRLASGRVTGDLPAITLMDKAGNDLGKIPGSPGTIEFSPCGQYLACLPWNRRDGRAGGMIIIHDLLTRGPALTFDVPASTCMRWSDDGRLIVLVGNSGAATLPTQAGTIEVHSAIDGRLVHAYSGHIGGATALAISPDQKLLASGGADGTILLWDFTVARKAATSRPAAAPDFPAAWDALAGDDDKKGYAARWAFIDAGEKGLAALAERVKPYESVAAERIEKLVAQLDSDSSDERDKAQQQLAKLASQAGNQLRDMMDKAASEEVRERLKTLVESAKSARPTSEEIRACRAIAIARQIGGPQAVKVLDTLAKSTKDSRPAIEAADALKELSARAK